MSYSGNEVVSFVRIEWIALPLSLLLHYSNLFSSLFNIISSSSKLSDDFLISKKVSTEHFRVLWKKNSLCHKSFVARWSTNSHLSWKDEDGETWFPSMDKFYDGRLEICFVQTLSLREFLLFHFLSLSKWVELSFIFFSITMLEAWQKKIGQIFSIAIKVGDLNYWRKLSLDETWFMSPKNQMIEKSHSVESYSKFFRMKTFKNINLYCTVLYVLLYICIKIYGNDLNYSRRNNTSTKLQIESALQCATQLGFDA